MIILIFIALINFRFFNWVYSVWYQRAKCDLPVLFFFFQSFPQLSLTFWWVFKLIYHLSVKVICCILLDNVSVVCLSVLHVILFVQIIVDNLPNGKLYFLQIVKCIKWIKLIEWHFNRWQTKNLFFVLFCFARSKYWLKCNHNLCCFYQILKSRVDVVDDTRHRIWWCKPFFRVLSSCSFGNLRIFYTILENQF